MTPSERTAELERALARLDEALALPSGESVVRDAAIHRFEFTFELAWKAVQARLASDLVQVTGSPRAVLREAHKWRLIDDEAAWVSLLLDRNLTTHTYKEDVALAVFGRLPAHAALLHRLLRVLKERDANAAP